MRLAGLVLLRHLERRVGQQEERIRRLELLHQIDVSGGTTVMYFKYLSRLSCYLNDFIISHRRAEIFRTKAKMFFFSGYPTDERLPCL